MLQKNTQTRGILALVGMHLMNSNFICCNFQQVAQAMTPATPRTTPLVKDKFKFDLRISQMSGSVQLNYGSQNLLKLNMKCQR